MLKAQLQSSWMAHVAKVIAVTASTGGALVSIVTALYSYGVIGKSESHQSIGNMGAAWVRLRPAADTATAIGDTIRFAATIADRKGSILVGAAPTWTTGDSTVATVAGDGSVIARGAGATTISVVVGTIVSTSRVVVRQQVASVAVRHPAGDTALAVPEGGLAQLRAQAMDSRGHTVEGRTALWRSDDTTVAVVDARGLVAAQNAGSSVVTVQVDGVTGRLPIAVRMTASALTAVAGASQQALAGRALAEAIVVRATNRKGAPAAGKLVTFHARAGGRAEPATATTDADGRARTQWTLGDDPGIQTLVASVENVDSTLVVAAEAEPVAKNTRLAALADSLRGRAGILLADSVGVRVTDSLGRALPGVPVRWQAVHGTVEALDARTDSAGVARARWNLGPATGTQRLRAFAGAAGSRVPPVSMVAIAMAGPPAAIVVTGGEGQRAAAGATLGKAIGVRVLDGTGNGVPGVAVLFTPSGGVAADSATVTDSLGNARTRWTMGRSAGECALAVRVAGVERPVKVVARAIPAAPANLSFDDAPPVPRARPGTRRLVAMVADIYGNPVADRAVSFSVKSGTVAPARAVTDAHGRVLLSWTLGADAREQRLAGAVHGTDVTGAYVAGPGAPSRGKGARGMP